MGARGSPAEFWQTCCLEIKCVNPERIRVLLVEDEPVYAGLLQEILAASVSPGFDLTHTSRLSDGLDVLAGRTFDVVLLDLTLPDRQGLASYAELHARAPAMPIIVLTGVDDEKLALQAVREGAQDYLVKGHVEGKMLPRVIRYAIERKRAAEALRQSEEFFRLISENVSDLIAVIDRDGRRLYNSPSYQNLLGDPARLVGTDSFEEIYPEDRASVKNIFQETLRTGIGRRAEYRLIRKDGSVRYIESQGSAIRDETGAPSKIVVVSRDVTDRMDAVAVLKDALSDVKQSHEQLKATQRQLIQAEKLEAVSTFAAGVAHEVKNPLQTIILGVDYLSNHVVSGDATAAMVLADMSTAVMRADGIIHGLLEFSSTGKRDVKPEDLTWIVEQSLQAVGPDFVNYPIRVVKDLATEMPVVRLDARTMKHVFINLLMHAVGELRDGGQLVVRTFSRELTDALTVNGRPSGAFKAGETVVSATVESTNVPPVGEPTDDRDSTVSGSKPIIKESGLGLAVLKKIIELYGGVMDVTSSRDSGSRYTILFKAHRKE